MATLEGYLKKLIKWMEATQKNTQNLKKKKDALVLSLKQNFVARKPLISLILEEELPLISKVLDREEKITRLVRNKVIPVERVQSIIGFFARIRPALASLQNTLKNQAKALEESKITSFLEKRRREESLYKILDDYINRELPNLNDASWTKKMQQSLWFLRQRGKPTLSRAAAVILITASVTLTSCTKKPEQGQFVHKVKNGQNFSTIYNSYKDATIPYDLVVQINKRIDPNFDPNYIRPGQKIVFPLREGVKAPVQKENKFYHASDNFRDEVPLITFARCIFGEAQGCNLNAKMAVGAIAVYRMWSPTFPNNIHDVILTSEQFSCFNKGDDQLEKVKDPEAYSEEEWNECIAIAQHYLQVLHQASQGKRVEMPIPVSFHYRDSRVGILPAPYIFTGEVKVGNLGRSFHFYVDASRDRISDNFRIKEFLYPGCQAVSLNIKLIAGLEQLRKIGGNRSLKIVGLRIGDGWTIGDAVDVVIKGATIEEMKLIANGAKLKFEGDAIHVQVGGAYTESKISPKTGKLRKVELDTKIH